MSISRWEDEEGANFFLGICRALTFLNTPNESTLHGPSLIVLKIERTVETNLRNLATAPAESAAKEPSITGIRSPITAITIKQFCTVFIFF